MKCSPQIWKKFSKLEQTLWTDFYDTFKKMVDEEIGCYILCACGEKCTILGECLTCKCHKPPHHKPMQMGEEETIGIRCSECGGDTKSWIRFICEDCKPEESEPLKTEEKEDHTKKIDSRIIAGFDIQRWEERRWRKALLDCLTSPFNWSDLEQLRNRFL